MYIYLIDYSLSAGKLHIIHYMYYKSIQIRMNDDEALILQTFLIHMKDYTVG